MKWGERRLQVLFFFATLLVIGRMVDTAAAVPFQGYEVAKTVYLEGDSRASIPLVRGMADLALQAKINRTLKAAILSLKNPSRGSSLHGDFSITFSNDVLLGIHFQGDSNTPRTAHPTKIDCGIHIDMTQGIIFGLDDLFRKGVLYEEHIKKLCEENQKHYRLRIPGLWDGWTYNYFADNWYREDEGFDSRLFLLFRDSLRVYTIPCFATGPIGGYRIPYASLERIIDHKGDLWKRISYRGERE
mgnify:CR=1 FL=1